MVLKDSQEKGLTTRPAGSCEKNDGLFVLILDKTVRVLFLKNIASEAVCDGKASSANRMELTASAFCTSCTITLCLR